jgi:hypothetical protein
MSRRDEAIELLRLGHSPGSVAARMKVSIDTVLPYLFHGIGSGKLSRTQVVFAIPRELRIAVEERCRELGQNAIEHKIVSAFGRFVPPANSDDVRAYVRLRGLYRLGGFDNGLLGDMYQLVADVEMTLHAFVRQGLEFMFGEKWWREGVSENIRKECVTSQEGDPEPTDDPFCYTNFIHLKQILDKHWGNFQRVLPVNLARNKNEFLTRLVKLNQIRNRVMHPVKQQSPTEDDFVFVSDCFNFFQFFEWKIWTSQRGTDKEKPTL